MKTRTLFVSNSSSSSFVVIDTINEKNTDLGNSPIIIGKHGETNFGWGPEKITDVFSRINFAYLQTLYTPYQNEKTEWERMLYEVIKEYSGVEVDINIITIKWDYPEWMRFGYIDHQSNAGERENIEIFENKEILAAFLFGRNSAIMLDHDNH